MTKLFTAALMLFALTVYLGAADHEPTPDQFKELCGVAQDMDHTTIGMSYEDHFGDAIHDDMVSALKACGPRSKPPFWVDMVFVLGADGKVEHIFSDPSQPVSGCVAGRLGREKFPAPPHGHWLQLVDIHITE